MRRLLAWLLAAGVAIGVATCGQKGPLRLPPEPAALLR